MTIEIKKISEEFSKGNFPANYNHLPMIVNGE